MVSSGFFNSSNGDRKYSAEQISMIIDYLINDGILETYGDKFFTTPSTSTLGVVLGSGWAWFDYTWTQSDTPILFSQSQSDPSLDRIDTIFLRVDKRPLNRVNDLGLLEGAPGLNPKPRDLPVVTDVYYHPLAYVRVRANATRISATDIDILVGKTNAPFITSILQTTDITTLFQGWSEQFGTKMTQWQTGYDAKLAEWEEEIDTLETSLTSNVDALVTSGTNQLAAQQSDYNAKMTVWQSTFSSSLSSWEADFMEWFEHLQTYLSEDVVTNLQLQIDNLNTSLNNLATKEANDISTVNASITAANTAINNVSNKVDNIPKLNGDALLLGTNTNYGLITPLGLNVFAQYRGSFYLPLFILDTMSFYVPPVTACLIMGISGGGGGGGTSGSIRGGGGGGSGQNVFIYKFFQYRSLLDITIGAGGTGGATGASNTGTTGGKTILKENGSIVLSVNGGGPGYAGSSGGGGAGYAGGGGGGGSPNASPVYYGGDPGIGLVSYRGGYGGRGGGNGVVATSDGALGSFGAQGGTAGSNSTYYGGNGGEGGTNVGYSSYNGKGGNGGNGSGQQGGGGGGGGGYGGYGGNGGSGSQPGTGGFGFGGGGGGGSYSGSGGGGGGGGGLVLPDMAKNGISIPQGSAGKNSGSGGSGAKGIVILFIGPSSDIK